MSSLFSKLLAAEWDAPESSSPEKEASSPAAAADAMRCTVRRSFTRATEPGQPPESLLVLEHEAVKTTESLDWRFHAEAGSESQKEHSLMQMTMESSDVEAMDTYVESSLEDSIQGKPCVPLIPYGSAEMRCWLKLWPKDSSKRGRRCNTPLTPNIRSGYRPMRSNPSAQEGHRRSTWRQPGMIGAMESWKLCGLRFVANANIMLNDASSRTTTTRRRDSPSTMPRTKMLALWKMMVMKPQCQIFIMPNNELSLVVKNKGTRRRGKPTHTLHGPDAMQEGGGSSSFDPSTPWRRHGSAAKAAASQQRARGSARRVAKPVKPKALPAAARRVVLLDLLFTDEGLLQDLKHLASRNMPLLKLVAVTCLLPGAL